VINGPRETSDYVVMDLAGRHRKKGTWPRTSPMAIVVTNPEVSR
jgi:septum formation inhibitor-activating ATPase MinD